MNVCCGFGDLDWGCFVFAPWGTRRPGRIAASQQSRPSQSSLTHRHPASPPPPLTPSPAPQKPKPRLPKHCQKMFPRSSVPAVYWHDLAGCLALIYKYKYISVCVCVFLCVGAYVMRSCSGTDSVFRKSQEWIIYDLNLCSLCEDMIYISSD
jgi:hypothetical protein